MLAVLVSHCDFIYLFVSQRERERENAVLAGGVAAGGEAAPAEQGG